MYKINNIKTFQNKLEPFRILYPAFGLKSWRIVNDNNVTTLHWTSKVYMIVISSLFLYGSITYISPVLVDNKTSSIFSYATIVLYIAGTINPFLIWQSNTNSKTVIKILKLFDDIESFAPKLNAFIHGSNNLYIFCHFISFFFVFLSFLLLFQWPIVILKKIIQIHVLRCFYIFISNFILYQFCNILNMSGSYINIMKISLCKLFKKPEYYQKSNDPVMFTLKSIVIQNTKHDSTKEHIFSELDVATMKIMYVKVMEAVDLTNYKFNLQVSLKDILYYFYLFSTVKLLVDTCY